MGGLGQIGERQCPLTEIERELVKVKRKLSLSKMERDILKKWPHTLPRRRHGTRWAGRLRLTYPAALLCRALDMMASGYYAWIKRPLSLRQREEERLELEIRAAHKQTLQTYGPAILQRICWIMKH